MIGFCAWREGLLLRPRLADDISGVSDLAERGLRLANRESGAEARSLLDREMSKAGIEASQLRGYDTRVTGHLQIEIRNRTPRAAVQQNDRRRILRASFAIENSDAVNRHAVIGRCRGRRVERSRPFRMTND